MSENLQSELLAGIAAQIACAAAELPGNPLTGFLALKGKAYTGELMWAGRAVNGWMGSPNPG